MHSQGPERKAAMVVLTDEEQRLLEEEGISLPTDMPLTKVCCLWLTLLIPVTSFDF